jgi:hypothetical protein
MSNARKLIIPPTVASNNQQVILGATNGDIDFEIIGISPVVSAFFVASIRYMESMFALAMFSNEEVRTCFIPRAQTDLPKVVQSINKFCQAIELYHTSDSK